MVRRFMSWLLHQLQKLLGAISRHRSHTRPVAHNQEQQTLENTGTALQEQGSVSASTATPTDANISFSIQQTDSVHSRTTTSDDADTHMRLDAASSTVPGSYSELSSANALEVENLDVESSVNEARSPSESMQLADQLPSIHDLLPAVEQEIKESAAQQDKDIVDSKTPIAEPTISQDEHASLPSPRPDLTSQQEYKGRIDPRDRKIADLQSADSKPADIQPIQPEPVDLGVSKTEDTEVSEQAVLFSFDITESADNKESNAEVKQDSTSDPSIEIDSSGESSLGKEEAPVTSVESKIDADSSVSQDPDTTASLSSQSIISSSAISSKSDAESELVEVKDSETEDIAQVDRGVVNRGADSTKQEDKSQEPKNDNPEPNAFDNASLPYPWSIATPKNTASASEDKAASQLSQSEISQDDNSSIESDSLTTRSTKNGVVKLLFTMKEGNFHGYIEPRDGTSDILFHQKYINEDIFDRLERGVEVVVSVKYMEGKAYATQVELAK